MIKYIVLEIQTYADGNVGTLISSYDDRNAAESKYHTVLAAAAISQIPLHSAVILTNEGYILESRNYTYTAPEPEPEPSPIEETEPEITEEP